jgi:Family of unknown function (DUF5677)
MASPVRKPEEITPDLLRRAVDDLFALVDERLPERFYPSEPISRVCLTALVARMAATLDSIAMLADPRRAGDTLVLLRTLYEHAVMFLWLAIDPEPRVDDWYGHTIKQRRTLHLDAVKYGVGDLMDPEELRVAEEAEKLKPLEQRAMEVDAFWAPRIRGFYENPVSGPKNVLTVEGLYLVIYRLASRDAHATIESVDPFITRLTGHKMVVSRGARHQTMLWAGVSLPIFAMALVVAHERLGWPDEDRVREINDGLMRKPSDGND